MIELKRAFYFEEGPMYAQEGHIQIMFKREPKKVEKQGDFLASLVT